MNPPPRKLNPTSGDINTSLALALYLGVSCASRSSLPVYLPIRTLTVNTTALTLLLSWNSITYRWRGIGTGSQLHSHVSLLPTTTSTASPHVLLPHHGHPQQQHPLPLPAPSPAPPPPSAHVLLLSQFPVPPPSPLTRHALPLQWRLLRSQDISLSTLRGCGRLRWVQGK